jgi:hypothetical protein
MKPKVLTQAEVDILEGKPSYLLEGNSKVCQVG